MFGAASFAIDMVGSVGYLIQMAGTWTNNRTFTDIGLGVQTGAAALGDGLTQVTAATFDTSSGAFQTGRTYVDTMLVVDVGIGLVKAAVPILKLAAAGVKALRLGIQAVTKIAYTGTKALIRAGRRAAATLLEDGWTAFKRIFEKAEGASPSVKAATAGDEAFHYTSTKWLNGIMSDGLRKGAYATPEGTLSPLQATLDLALPPNRALPNVTIRIDLAGLRNSGYEIPTPTRVSSTVTGAGGRVYTMPGGGYEILFPYEIPPQFLSVVER